jgi:hypothetical protein
VFSIGAVFLGPFVWLWAWSTVAIVDFAFASGIEGTWPKLGDAPSPRGIVTGVELVRSLFRHSEDVRLDRLRRRAAHRFALWMGWLFAGFIVLLAASAAIQAAAVQLLGKPVPYSACYYLIAFGLVAASLAWSRNRLGTDEAPDPLHLFGVPIGYLGIGAQVPRFLIPRLGLLACLAVATVASVAMA